jgi:hypothetical protein
VTRNFFRTGRRQISGLAAVALFLVAAPAPADVITVAATDNATVQPDGPRPGDNGKRFFNMEGSANMNFASFGVLDFGTSTFMATSVTGATLQLTQANTFFTMNGGLQIFLVPDTTTDIQPVTSPLKYVPPNPGLGTQLGTPLSLGTAMFVQGTGGPFGDGSGTVDTFNLTISPSAAALLQSEINAGKVRIVVAPDSATVAATYAGFSNDLFTGPILQLNGTFQPAVPEPSSLALAGFGIASLFGVARFWCRRIAR